MSEATSDLNQVPPQTQEKKSFLSRIFGKNTDTGKLDEEREAFMNAKAIATETGIPQRIKVDKNEYEISDPDKIGTQVKPL